MSQDFSELVEYLDKKFEKTATKEDIAEFRVEVEGKFNRAFDVFATKEEIRTLGKEVGDLKETVHALVTSIDKLAKAIDDLRIEYSSIAMKVDRHEKWIQQLAEKFGIKLQYD